MADRLTVGRLVLVQKIGVRFPVRQHKVVGPQCGCIGVLLLYLSDGNRKTETDMNFEAKRRKKPVESGS